MANGKKLSIELGLTKKDCDRDVRGVLELTTDKGSRGIYSMAAVVWVGGGFKTCMIFSDYSARLMNDKAARATQGNIDKQFATVFTTEKVAELTAAAKAFYAETVCGNCEHVWKGGKQECPRCECTDVMTRAEYDAAKAMPSVPVAASAIAPVPTWTEVTA